MPAAVRYCLLQAKNGGTRSFLKDIPSFHYAGEEVSKMKNATNRGEERALFEVSCSVTLNLQHIINNILPTIKAGADDDDDDDGGLRLFPLNRAVP